MRRIKSIVSINALWFIMSVFLAFLINQSFTYDSSGMFKIYNPLEHNLSESHKEVNCLEKLVKIDDFLGEKNSKDYHINSIGQFDQGDLFLVIILPPPKIQIS